MMEKEIQRKKKVLIDLTNYGSLTAGFGQIAANYAAAFFVYAGRGSSFCIFVETEIYAGIWPECDLCSGTSYQ